MAGDFTRAPSPSLVACVAILKPGTGVTCLASLAPAKLRGLNEFLQRHESRLRPALAIGAGLLLAAAFPKLGIAGLAWVAPGLLLFSASGQPGKVAFRLGWLGGFAFHLAALQPGHSIAVFGVGGVGLNVIQGAGLVNAYPLVAVDLQDWKLEQARAFGATHTLNARDANLVSALRDASGGRGFPRQI